MTDWYYQMMNDVVGPVVPSELIDKIREGHIKRDTLIRKDDSQWVPAWQVNGLFDAAERTSDLFVCPYCGVRVEKPPSTCGECGRRLVVSFSRRRDASKGPTHEQVIEEAKKEYQRIDRREIIRYFAMLVLVVGLLATAPYLLYLASSARNMTLVYGLIITMFIGLMFFAMLKLS